MGSAIRSVASPALVLRADGRQVTYRIDNNVLVLDPGQFTDLADLAVGESETVVLHYDVSDGKSVTTQTLTLTVEGRNDAPVLAGALIGTTDDNSLFQADLLAGATDVDASDTLSVAELGELTTADGTGVPFTLSGATLSFDTAMFDSLQVGESETLTLHYAVGDGNALVPQTLTIRVDGANDVPVAYVDRAATLRNATKVILASDLLVNDFDVEGDALSVTEVLNPTHGSVSYDPATGEILFTPEAGFVGTAATPSTAARAPIASRCSATPGSPLTWAPRRWRRSSAAPGATRSPAAPETM